jgi:hypothetical protein
VAAAVTCIDFGRRGRRGDEGGDPSGVEADPESRELSPRMEPRNFPFFVGESTAAAKALSCLKLRSCLSSRGVDPNGESGVDSGVPAEDRKNQLGVRDGDRALDAAARGVASLSAAASAASLGPGLVNLLRAPHFLTDPRRDKMEDLEELEVSEGGRSTSPWFGEDGCGGEGKGAKSCPLSSISKTLLSGGRDFFRKRRRVFCAGGLGGNIVRADAFPPRKGRWASEEYVLTDSRPEGMEKTDKVGDPGKVSPTDSSGTGSEGMGGGGERLPRRPLRGRAVTVLSSSSTPSSSSDESQAWSFRGDTNLFPSRSSSQFSGSGISGSLGDLWCDREGGWRAGELDLSSKSSSQFSVCATACLGGVEGPGSAHSCSRTVGSWPSS